MCRRTFSRCSYRGPTSPPSHHGASARPSRGKCSTTTGPVLDHHGELLDHHGASARPSRGQRSTITGPVLDHHGASAPPSRGQCSTTTGPVLHHHGASAPPSRGQCSTITGNALDQQSYPHALIFLVIFPSRLHGGTKSFEKAHSFINFVHEIGAWPIQLILCVTSHQKLVTVTECTGLLCSSMIWVLLSSR